MIYTLGAILAIVAAVLFDLFGTRQSLVRTARFWIAYAIILFFQLIMNGFLTGLPIVTYDETVHLGLRVAYAPVEDIGFGFGMVLSVLTFWRWLSTKPDKHRAGQKR